VLSTCPTHNTSNRKHKHLKSAAIRCDRGKGYAYLCNGFDGLVALVDYALQVVKGNVAPLQRGALKQLIFEEDVSSRLPIDRDPD
jgi:hypothetical protein